MKADKLIEMLEKVKGDSTVFVSDNDGNDYSITSVHLDLDADTVAIQGDIDEDC